MVRKEVTMATLHRPDTKKSQKWVRRVILVVGAFVFAAFLIMDPLVRSATRRDRNSGPPREGTATVLQLFAPVIDDTGTNRPVPPHVLIQFEGKSYLTKDVYGYGGLKEHGPASLTYRVGKSGRVYIERVQPLASPK